MLYAGTSTDRYHIWRWRGLLKVQFLMMRKRRLRQSSTVHLQQNRHYFLRGGDVYFLADTQVFRLHSYFLERESNVFKKLIQPVAGGHRNGGSESTAIVLEVAPAAFEKFLDVIYNPKYSVYPDLPVEHWTTVIKLAQVWEFPEVLEVAIREVKKIEMTLISRIALYQRLNINQDHLIPLYGILCSRPQHLDYEESYTIGLTTTVLICTARERLRARPSDGGTSPLPIGLRDHDIYGVIMALLPGAALPLPPISG